MIGSNRETLTDKGNEPMSNINSALVLSEMILAGRMSREHIAIFDWLMGVFNGDRERTGAVIEVLEKEFQVELIYF